VEALTTFAGGLAASGSRGARLVATVAERAGAAAAAAEPEKTSLPSRPAPGAVDAAAIARLVAMTAAHPRFGELYRLPPPGERWTRAGPATAAPAPPPPPGTHPPPLLAIDCEMVGAGGPGGEGALVRVALVAARWGVGGGSEPAPSPPTTVPAVLAAAGAAAVDTVLAAAVRPAAPVSDWRAAVTGLGPGALDGAPFDRRGAACAVAAALTAAAAAAAAAGAPPPVLVGHALHHDLAALRLDTAGTSIIDTGLVHGWVGLPRAAPGLGDLHGAALPAAPPLRAAGAPHNCEADAGASLVLALRAAVEVVGVVAPPPRLLLPPPTTPVPRDALCRLLVHGLPPDAEPASVLAAAAAAAAAAAGAAAEAPADGAPGKVFLVFPSPAAADAAFAALAAASGAPRGADSLGRPQTSLALPGAARPARVRKAAAHGGLSHGRAPKRDRTAAEVARGKRARAGAAAV
jgi:hypothetical protein